MDTTKAALRELLQGEHDSLLQQVELARLRLEDAAEFRHRIEAPAPSVKEIKAFESKLEKMAAAPSSVLLDAIESLETSPRKARGARAAVAQAAEESEPPAMTPTPPKEPRSP